MKVRFISIALQFSLFKLPNTIKESARSSFASGGLCKECKDKMMFIKSSHSTNGNIGFASLNIHANSMFFLRPPTPTTLYLSCLKIHNPDFMLLCNSVLFEWSMFSFFGSMRLSFSSVDSGMSGHPPRFTRQK